MILPDNQTEPCHDVDSVRVRCNLSGSHAFPAGSSSLPCFHRSRTRSCPVSRTLPDTGDRSHPARPDGPVRCLDQGRRRAPRVQGRGPGRASHGPCHGTHHTRQAEALQGIATVRGDGEGCMNHAAVCGLVRHRGNPSRRSRGISSKHGATRPAEHSGQPEGWGFESFIPRFASNVHE